MDSLRLGALPRGPRRCAQRRCATDLDARAERTAGVAMSSPKGKKKPFVRQLVEFTHDELGSSRPDALSGMTDEFYGKGERGWTDFPHPNPKLAAEGWVYVRVASKKDPERDLFVPVSPGMFRVVKDPGK